MELDYGYKIADSLFDSLKEFAVLGLCGRTGSGCSSVAEILCRDFSQLSLPKPSTEPGSSTQAAEELILYNYAKVNWTPFYPIKVSRLMLGYVLNETPEAFACYLEKMFNNLLPKDRETIMVAVREFYNAKMEFVVPECFTQKIVAEFPDTKDTESANTLFWKDILKGLGGFLTEESLWEILFPSEIKEHSTISSANLKEKISQHINKEAPFSLNLRNHGEYPYEYIYDEIEKKCVFSIRIRDMQKLTTEYDSIRKGTGALKNSLLCWMLFQYNYYTLPQYAEKLLNEIGKIRRGLPIIILQDIGINLRTWEKPLIYDPEKQNAVFQERGFFTIIKRVNLCIKILRDHLRKQKEYQENILQLIKDNKENTASASLYAECLKLLKTASKKVVVVIDSIKNPFESMYLKARYSSYYLTAIYTDETDRRLRLENSPKGLTLQEIQVIDAIEQLSEFKKILDAGVGDNMPEDAHSMLSKAVLNQLAHKVRTAQLEKILPFITQNVDQCTESSDIFINNQNDNKQRFGLKKKLIRYVSLIMNPGLVLPTPIERCMQIAQTARACSGCISRQVGAVLTDNQYRIRSIGWNDVPDCRVPCIYRDIVQVSQHWNQSAYSKFENDDTDTFQQYINDKTWIQKFCELKREKGKQTPYCFKDIYNDIAGSKNQVHPRALHAEERAFLTLADQGGASIEGGYLFTTSSPCELCTKKLCYMGISKVYYVEPYSGISYKHVMCDGPEEQRPVQELFTGALGRAYPQLYTPVIPQKDELELWLGFKPDRKPETNPNEGEVLSTQTDRSESSLDLNATQEEESSSMAESEALSKTYNRRKRGWKEIWQRK